MELIKDLRMKKMILVTLFCILCVAVLSPVQLPVVIYKVCLVCLGALVFFWVDRLTFPYSRPGGYLVDPWQSNGIFKKGVADYVIVSGYETVFAMSFIRRAIMMCFGGALGVALGL